MKRIPLVLADDHAILRDGLRALIDSQPDLQVVGEAGTGPDAVARVGELLPRVLSLDLSMPGWGVVATIDRVKAVSPRTRVLVLSMHDDPAYIRSALSAGADGYILKTTPAETLLAAIRSIADGGRVIDPAIRDQLNEPKPAEGPEELSRREREVLRLLARGHTHQEIADRILVSVKSVETYRSRIRQKTGLKTRADFVRYGIESGLLGHNDVGDFTE